MIKIFKKANGINNPVFVGLHTLEVNTPVSFTARSMDTGYLINTWLKSEYEFAQHELLSEFVEVIYLGRGEPHFHQSYLQPCESGYLFAETDNWFMIGDASKQKYYNKSNYKYNVISPKKPEMPIVSNPAFEKKIVVIFSLGQAKEQLVDYYRDTLISDPVNLRELINNGSFESFVPDMKHISCAEIVQKYAEFDLGMPWAKAQRAAMVAIQTEKDTLEIVFDIENMEPHERWSLKFDCTM